MPFDFFAPANWLSSKLFPQQQPQTPTGLFQTRITRTPGGFAPIRSDVAGQYAPAVNPVDVVAAQQNLSPAEKATLSQAWAPQGSGFITMPPGNIPSDVIRHEQLHDLQQKAGLTAHAADIAPVVSPEITDMLKANPVYQGEAQKLGWPEVIADEGTAMDLINMANRMGGPSEALRGKVMQFVKSKVQQRQFAKLTQPPGQSQK